MQYPKNIKLVSQTVTAVPHHNKTKHTKGQPTISIKGKGDKHPIQTQQQITNCTVFALYSAGRAFCARMDYHVTHPAIDSRRPFSCVLPVCTPTRRLRELLTPLSGSRTSISDNMQQAIRTTLPQHRYPQHFHPHNARHACAWRNYNRAPTLPLPSSMDHLVVVTSSFFMPLHGCRCWWSWSTLHLRLHRHRPQKPPSLPNGFPLTLVTIPIGNFPRNLNVPYLAVSTRWALAPAGAS